MRAARCAFLNFLQTERAGRSRRFFFLFLLSNLIAKILRLAHRPYEQEYDEGNNKIDVALAVDSREMQTGIHASSTHPKQAASRFPRLPTRSTSPIRLPNLATKTLSANLNAFPRQSGVGITGLRKEDRKQKKGKHKCRNGFGEGDKIFAWLGVEILPPPASCNMRLGMIYRGAHQVLRELENAIYQQGKNNDGNHGYRFLPLCVYASFH